MAWRILITKGTESFVHIKYRNLEKQWGINSVQKLNS